jgi:hypothetical protein
MKVDSDVLLLSYLDKIYLILLLLLLLLFNHLPPDITGGQGLKKTFLSIFFTVQKHNNYDGI